MNVRFTKESRSDLSETVRYFNRQRDGLGRQFRTEVAATIERIKSVPEASRPLEGDARRRRMERFPYGIFYRSTGDEIVILAILHLRRDPESWRGRI